MTQRSPQRLVGAALALSLIGWTAAAVPVPGPPQAAGGAKGHAASKPAAAAPPAAPAAPVNPLLQRRRAAPPSQVQSQDVAEGQKWTLAIVTSDGPTCSGDLQIRKKDGEGTYSGEMSLACADRSARFAFRQDAVLIDVGDAVMMTFGKIKGDARAAHWQPTRLLKEGPEKMTGAVSDGTRSSALTLLLATAAP